jgi:hypothetical protein
VTTPRCPTFTTVSILVQPVFQGNNKIISAALWVTTADFLVSEKQQTKRIQSGDLRSL